MRYIRTIDVENIDNQKILEVYEITKGTEFEGLIYKCYIRHNDLTEAIVFDCDVIAQADTMEELFDELVVKHINNEKPYVADSYSYQKAQILKDRQKVFEYGVEEVKGAIYTNKGLIYVAKMNDTGEFELI